MECCETLIKLFFNYSSLRRRANARNVSFRISLRWLIHIVNPVDKTKLSCYTSYRRSTRVSLETYLSIFQVVSHLIGSVNPIKLLHFVLKLALCTNIFFPLVYIRNDVDNSDSIDEKRRSSVRAQTVVPVSPTAIGEAATLETIKESKKKGTAKRVV